MKKLIIALSLLTVASSALAGPRNELNATNNSGSALAVGSDVLVRNLSLSGASLGTLDVNAGVAAAGSIVVNKCLSNGCFKNVTLNNRSVDATAAGAAYAGSIIVE